MAGPAPGGVVADYFPLAKALGAKWLACGPLAAGAAGEVPMPEHGAAAVLEAGGVYAVPFVNFSTAPSYAAGPSFIIFDETSAPDPAALQAPMLAAELKTRPAPQKRLTVSEALRSRPLLRGGPAGSRGGGLALRRGLHALGFRGALQAAGALAALAQTRADLMLHLNAAQGNYSRPPRPSRG